MFAHERALPGRLALQKHLEIRHDQTAPFKSGPVSGDKAFLAVPEKFGNTDTQSGHGASLFDNGHEEPLAKEYIDGAGIGGNHWSPSGQERNACPDQNRKDLLSRASVKTGLCHWEAVFVIGIGGKVKEGVLFYAS